MKPLLCNTQVVQNILAGRQTQDRRPIKPQPKSNMFRMSNLLAEAKEIICLPTKT